MFLAQLEALLVLLGILFLGYAMYRIWFKKSKKMTADRESYEHKALAKCGAF